MRSRPIVVAAALVVAVTVLAPAVATGKVYVADAQSGGGTGCANGDCGAIFAVPSAGGDGVVLAPGAPGGVLQHPAGLVPANDKTLFAGDYGADSIVRVNRDSGAVHTFVDGPKVTDPRDLGRTHDAVYYTTYDGDLFRVDLDTKSVRQVNSEPLSSPTGVAVTGGHAYVANQTNPNDIYKIDLDTGRVRYLVKDTQKWVTGGELKLSPDHDFLYLAASSPGIMRIRISDGRVHKVADVDGTPLSLARRDGGGFVVGNNYYGEVERVAKDGTVTPFSQNPLFEYPTAGLVISP